MKRISILGSTGSIGTQTLDVVRANRDIHVCALAAGRNIRRLEKQIREFRPEMAAVWNERDACELRGMIADLNVRVRSGMDGLIEAATVSGSDICVTAIVGMIGIRPTIEAIMDGKNIALANKETLVCAGHLIMPLARQNGVKILPVDSEHSAIFQCLNGENAGRIEKILLTCSGGTFRGKKREDLLQVSVEDALKNPNWVMGSKVTLDSATLVNKGLEVMEARWLFGVPGENIEVVVQPQSILHSAVQFTDGAIMAQMGTPDMRLPIQYALYYPDRRPMATKRLSLTELGTMTFEAPDTETFLGLPLARRAMKTGGTMPTVFNAANEAAVKLFIGRRIRFLDIYEVIGYCMDQHTVRPNPSVETILEAEREVGELVAARFGKPEDEE